MKLIIAEKPSVANDIARVLNIKTKHNGYLEGNGYQITWCLGHLVQLAPPNFYGVQYKAWTIDNLPIIPDCFRLEINPNTKKQFDIVKTLIERNDEYIICATDAGREGQLIFEYVFRLTDNYAAKIVKRLWISSMTDEAIKDGLAHLQDNADYESLYQAARCRSEADWLVGMNFTRLFSVKYNTKLTVGRVQTPTLALIVERHQTIQNFKSEPFYELMGDFDFLTFSAKWSNAATGSNRLTDKAAAEKLKRRLDKSIGHITQLTTTPKSLERPLLFDLTELQREANRRYGYTAQETLETAQSLYETHKITTYPRTDSRYLTDDMTPTLPALLEAIYTAFPEAQPYIKRIQQNGLNTDKRIIDNNKVTDHHAIIVTPKLAKYDLFKLSDQERNILKLIMTRLLLTLDHKKEFEETFVEIAIDDCPNDRFTVTGRKILDEGWLWIERALLGRGDEENDTNALILPALQLGQEVALETVNIVEKKTTPPKPYTEATLLTAMEHAGQQLDDPNLKTILKQSNGLGTPATRAAIIEKLIKAGYIERKKKSLHPTAQGIKFISILPAEIKSPELTARWEERLEKIRQNQENPAHFINDITDFIKTTITQSKTVAAPEQLQAFAMKPPKEIIGQCPRCGKNVYENQRSFYCEGYKDDPKCNFSLWKEDKFWTSRGVKITKTYAKKLLKDGQIELHGLKSKAGNNYNAIFKMDISGEYVRFEVNLL